MIANALNDKPLPVYGEGINVRDWLYVEDHCAAIDRSSAMEKKARSITLADIMKCEILTLSN